MQPDQSIDRRMIAKSRAMDRGPYFFWGFGLMMVKYNLDRAIAWWGFHRNWYFWNYVKPHGFAPIDAMPPDDRSFFYILLLTSLPFIIVGIWMTLRRLQSAGLPLALCVLFFVPVLNLVFFAVLTALPARQASRAPPARWGQKSFWLPVSAAGSALLATLLVGGLGIGCVYLSTRELQNYGWGLFVALPFAMGLVSVLIYGASGKRTIESCMLVSILPVAFMGAALLGLAVEGVICLLMAAPIALALALCGGAVGYFIIDSRPARLGSSAMCLALAAVPITMCLERQANEVPPLFSVTSSVVIGLPAEKIWPNVVSFSEIPAEREFIFHTGIAYPVKSRIEGKGVGAVRHCIFSTGEFIEPIQVWDEPRVLRFGVSHQPEPMEELSPYPHLKTTHLNGYFQSREGELRLTALPGGRTLLEGTTWYTNQMWPAGYWKLWSDFIIHRIHLRVLNHIKAISEDHPIS